MDVGRGVEQLGQTKQKNEAARTWDWLFDKAETFKCITYDQHILAEDSSYGEKQMCPADTFRITIPITSYAFVRFIPENMTYATAIWNLYVPHTEAHGIIGIRNIRNRMLHRAVKRRKKNGDVPFCCIKAFPAPSFEAVCDWHRALDDSLQNGFVNVSRQPLSSCSVSFASSLTGAYPCFKTSHAHRQL